MRVLEIHHTERRRAQYRTFPGPKAQGLVTGRWVCLVYERVNGYEVKLQFYIHVRRGHFAGMLELLEDLFTDGRRSRIN